MTGLVRMREVSILACVVSRLGKLRETAAENKHQAFICSSPDAFSIEVELQVVWPCRGLELKGKLGQT